MLVIFYFAFREDKNIVKVYYIEYINVAIKGTVNIGLEGGGSIGQTKRHDEVFVVTISRSKGGLLLVSFLYSYLIVGVS